MSFPDFDPSKYPPESRDAERAAWEQRKRHYDFWWKSGSPGEWIAAIVAIGATVLFFNVLARGC